MFDLKKLKPHDVVKHKDGTLWGVHEVDKYEDNGVPFVVLVRVLTLEEGDEALVDYEKVA